MKYHHFCNCGPHFHCGQPIVHRVCEVCGDEYLGPDCEVTRPLPVIICEDGSCLCRTCYKKKKENLVVAV